MGSSRQSGWRAAAVHFNSGAQASRATAQDQGTGTQNADGFTVNVDRFGWDSAVGDGGTAGISTRVKASRISWGTTFASCG